MVAMAAHATRSASGADSSSDDVSRCLLLALSHDELGVIVDGLADPLQPVVAVAFSSTCKGLRTPPVLERARLILVQRYFRALALCRKMKLSCIELRDGNDLTVEDQGLTTDHAAALGMILRTSGLPRLQSLNISKNLFGNAGVQAFCDDLGYGVAPCLKYLDIEDTGFGPAGAEALAAALLRGAMPRLEILFLSFNPIGNQGATALAASLRQMPALKALHFIGCGISDEGVASLFKDLGKDDFKALQTIFFEGNAITDVGHSTLVKTLDGGGMPSVHTLDVLDNPASLQARLAIIGAVVRACKRACKRAPDIAGRPPVCRLGSGGVS